MASKPTTILEALDERGNFWRPFALKKRKYVSDLIIAWSRAEPDSDESKKLTKQIQNRTQGLIKTAADFNAACDLVVANKDFYEERTKEARMTPSEKLAQQNRKAAVEEKPERVDEEIHAETPEPEIIRVAEQAPEEEMPVAQPDEEPAPEIVEAGTFTRVEWNVRKLKLEHLEALLDSSRALYEEYIKEDPSGTRYETWLNNQDQKLWDEGITYGDYDRHYEEIGSTLKWIERVKADRSLAIDDQAVAQGPLYSVMLENYDDDRFDLIELTGFAMAQSALRHELEAAGGPEAEIEVETKIYPKELEQELLGLKAISEEDKEKNTNKLEELIAKQKIIDSYQPQPIAAFYVHYEEIAAVLKKVQTETSAETDFENAYDPLYAAIIEGIQNDQFDKSELGLYASLSAELNRAKRPVWDEATFQEVLDTYAPLKDTPEETDQVSEEAKTIADRIKPYEEMKGNEKNGYHHFVKNALYIRQIWDTIDNYIPEGPAYALYEQLSEAKQVNYFDWNKISQTVREVVKSQKGLTLYKKTDLLYPQVVNQINRDIVSKPFVTWDITRVAANYDITFPAPPVDPNQVALDALYEQVAHDVSTGQFNIPSSAKEIPYYIRQSGEVVWPDIQHDEVVERKTVMQSTSVEQTPAMSEISVAQYDHTAVTMEQLLKTLEMDEELIDQIKTSDEEPNEHFEEFEKTTAIIRQAVTDFNNGNVGEDSIESDQSVKNAIISAFHENKTVDLNQLQMLAAETARKQKTVTLDAN